MVSASLTSLPVNFAGAGLSTYSGRGMKAGTGRRGEIWYGVVVLLLVWLALLLVGFRWWTPHPVRLAFLPVVSLALWFGIVLAGDVWLHWTA
jgi:hypothetical protein